MRSTARWLGVAMLSFGAMACGRGEASTDDVDAAVTPSKASAAAGFARDAQGAFVGFHLGSRFTSSIDAKGAHLAGMDGASWTMGLHVTRIGREGALHAVADAAPNATETRVEIAHGDQPHGGVAERGQDGCGRVEPASDHRDRDVVRAVTIQSGDGRRQQRMAAASRAHGLPNSASM
jgi:hypothetical protein